MLPNEKNPLVPMRSVTGWSVYELREIKCMDRKRPFSYALHGLDVGYMPKRGGTVFLMVFHGIIRFLLHRNIKRKPPLLVHMGPLRSRECRLGCAMHPPHFRDV